MTTADPRQAVRQAVATVQADDGSLNNTDLIAAYEAGPAQLRAAMSGMSIDQLRARPVAGRWSSLEVLCHLADCEQFFADRMKRTIATDRPLLLGADGFRYPLPLHYQERDPGEELDLVELTRKQMARIFKLLPEETWLRTAVHSETGLVTLRQLVIHTVRHQDLHLAFVAEKRRALGLS